MEASEAEHLPSPRSSYDFSPHLFFSKVIGSLLVMKALLRFLLDLPLSFCARGQFLCVRFDPTGIFGSAVQMGYRFRFHLTAINELAIGCLPCRPSFLLGGARLFSVLGHVQTCLLGKLPYSLSFQILTGNDSNGSMSKCCVAFILSPSVSLPVSPLATTCQGHIYHSGTSTWRQPTYTHGT